MSQPQPSEPLAGAPVPPLDAPVAQLAVPALAQDGMRLPRLAVGLIVVLLMAALATTAVLWQKLAGIQEQLARQSADAGANAIEARTLARQAQELARETAGRQAVAENRLAEVALQRSQLEELMQSLSRSRDENLVVDIESALQLAQQQAQLSLSAEPLLAALRTADLRLSRAAQPRLARVRAAIARDTERIRAARVADVPGLLVRLDELSRQVDDLPLANAVAAASVGADAKGRPQAAPSRWWERALAVVRDEARLLVRISRVDHPDAVLLSPEQGFFLRENLKLKLLNARLSLLARHTESARSDVAGAAVALGKYFDPAARRTQAASAALAQLQAQLRTVELPRIDETLAVLATAAAGR